MEKNSLIYVVDNGRFISSAIVRKLKEKGYRNLLLKKLDLLNQRGVETFFKKWRPEYLFFLPIKSGGILANRTWPADFIYWNLTSQVNLIHSAFKYGVKKLLFLGSACSYPKFCPQPIKEDSLLSGPVENTNEPFAIAMISGIKMCQAYKKQYKANFICAIPTNVYGPGDRFDEEGHVVAGLIKKFHQAKMKKNEMVKIWGTGKPKREFLYVDDIAEACIFLMQNYNSSELINIGGGKEVSIRELANILKKITDFKGKVIYQIGKPDGIPRRLLDSTKIFGLGWRPKVELGQGLKLTHQWFQKYYGQSRTN